MPKIAALACIDPEGIPHREPPTRDFPAGRPAESALMHNSREYNFAPAGSGEVRLPNGTVIPEVIYIDEQIARWLASRPHMNPLVDGSPRPRLRIVPASATYQVAMIDGRPVFVGAGGRGLAVSSLEHLNKAPLPPPAMEPPAGSNDLKTVPHPPEDPMQRLAQLNDPSAGPADVRVG